MQHMHGIIPNLFDCLGQSSCSSTATKELHGLLVSDVLLFVNILLCHLLFLLRPLLLLVHLLRELPARLRKLLDVSKLVILKK